MSSKTLSCVLILLMISYCGIEAAVVEEVDPVYPCNSNEDCAKSPGCFYCDLKLRICFCPTPGPPFPLN
nr:hypothetical protein Iba_chr07cCG9380 [Ipomoea batatas]